MVMHDIDIFMVTETKLNDSLTVSKIDIEGFSLKFRKDLHKNGEGITLDISSSNKASKLTSFTFRNGQMRSLSKQTLKIVNG